CAMEAVKNYLRNDSHPHPTRYAALLVPPDLASDLRNHPALKSFRERSNFRLETFDEWLRALVPELEQRAVTAELELETLRELLGKGARGEPLTSEDLVYYQAMRARSTLKEDGFSALVNLQKEPTIGGDNARRRDLLTAVKPHRFLQAAKKRHAASTG